uniref:Uncharacterized protein n=1 Tax=Cacopsylla melanoneura TaxID=428564 RepID=A0A8D8WKA0_9HEMI
MFASLSPVPCCPSHVVALSGCPGYPPSQHCHDQCTLGGGSPASTIQWGYGATGRGGGADEHSGQDGTAGGAVPGAPRGALAWSYIGPRRMGPTGSHLLFRHLYQSSALGL